MLAVSGAGLGSYPVAHVFDLFCLCLFVFVAGMAVSGAGLGVALACFVFVFVIVVMAFLFCYTNIEQKDINRTENKFFSFVSFLY